MLVRKSYHKSLPNNSKPHSVHGDCFAATVKFNTSCSFGGIFDYTNISWKKGRTVCWLSWVFCQMQCKAAKQSNKTKHIGGSVAERLERWTCDSEAPNSNPALGRVVRSWVKITQGQCKFSLILFAYNLMVGYSKKKLEKIIWVLLIKR